MNSENTCPECGKPLPGDAPQGICPDCLMRAGLGSSVEIGPETDAGGQRLGSGFVPPSPEEIAPRFPELEILSLAGRGGMGAVYKARQKQLDRIVALKILPPGLQADPSFAGRFVREAQALAKLHHPHIVTLFEFGQVDGLFFFLMEFVDGVNLRQLLANSRISAREALAIVPQICEALQYAHDRGIVHRDIKPENILLNRQGQVKIADFGVARILNRATESGAAGTTAEAAGTEAGRIVGTPQYMAPEQVSAPGEVDHRADIYALGVVFYQMLTGQMPGSDLEPPSRKVRIDVRLDEIVLRALEKNRDLRYQQASEIVSHVQTVTDGPADGAGKGSGGTSAEPTGKSTAPKRSLVAALALVALLLMAVAAFPVLKRLARPESGEFRSYSGVVAGSRPGTRPTRVVKFSTGVTAELVGVAEHPDPSESWTPDGLRIQPVPSDFKDHGTRIYPGRDEIAREFYVQFGSLPPPGDVSVRHRIAGGAATGSGTNYKRGTGVIRLDIVAAFAAQAKTASLSLGVAAGPWKTIAMSDGKSGSGINQASSAPGNSVVISKADSGNNPTVVTVSHNYGLMDYALVGVTENGLIYVANETDSYQGSGFLQTTYSFPNTGSPVVNFRFQVREFEWREIGNIALHPAAGAAKPELSTAATAGAALSRFPNADAGTSTAAAQSTAPEPKEGGLQFDVRSQDGRPIVAFRVIAGVRPGISRSSDVIANWQPHTLQLGRNGALSWNPHWRWDETIFRVEADGYQPAMTAWIIKSDEPGRLSLTLAADPGIRGRVLSPDGAPASSATLALAMVQRDARISGGQLVLSDSASTSPGDAWRRPVVVEADGDGRYLVPQMKDPSAAVLILHESGVREMSFSDFERALEITLQNWGRVEGRVQWRETPGSSEPVSLGVHRENFGYPGVIGQYETTVTDSAGRFSFQKVIPGRVQIARIYPVSSEHGVIDAILPGMVMHVDIGAGEPTPVLLGGTGRTVRGRLTGCVSCENIPVSLGLNAPPVGMSGDEVQWEALAQFHKSPIGGVFGGSTRTKSDGSFTLPAVLPGDYQLYLGGALSGRRITVPPERPDTPAEDLDLGDIPAPV